MTNAEFLKTHYPNFDPRFLSGRYLEGDGGIGQYAIYYYNVKVGIYYGGLSLTGNEAVYRWLLHDHIENTKNYYDDNFFDRNILRESNNDYIIRIIDDLIFKLCYEFDISKHEICKIIKEHLNEDPQT